LKIIKRAEMLAYLMKDKKTIAVAGTHGKTTTTAMLASIFKKAGKDPAVMVGGLIEEIKGNVADGSGEYFITEADESDGSFLYFDPEILILNNLELDHPDYYRDIGEFKTIFKRFADKNDKKAYLLYNKDDIYLNEITKNRKRTISFSIEKNNNADYNINNIKFSNKESIFDIYKGDDFFTQIELSVPGIYNIYNAAAALTAADKAGVDIEYIKDALRSFSGVGRRFELRGKLLNGMVDIIDDYAHHPTEIKSLLKAVKNMDYKKVTAVFQPHRYSRTHKFLDEFTKSFSDADIVYLTDIFSASENRTEKISMHNFASKIELNSNTSCIYDANFDNIAEKILEDITEGELVITIGAGDVNNICNLLLNNRR